MQSTPRAGIPSFEEKLDNEEEILGALLAALSKGPLDDAVWQQLHDAAVRDDRVSELAFAYESVAQGRRLRTLVPAVQAELFFRAASFFGDVLGDEFGATTYLERALGAHPSHAGAFERIDAQLTRVDDHKKLAELCAQAAAHRPKDEQIVLLRRAADLFERAGLEDKVIEVYQQLVKAEPGDESLRDALEARYLRANRHRDVARMLEQALGADPAPGDASEIRAKLIDVFANQLKEPERAMPHVEALLEVDPTHPEARRVASRLLEVKGLAARAAAALAASADSSEDRARYLAIELESTRGPRRRDVLRRLGLLRQDELGDEQGAFEAFEQALGIDPSDDEVRARYVALGCQIKGPLDVARMFARVSTVAKDAAVRSRITAEMGELLLRGGDAKRARTTLGGVVAAPSADPGAVLVAARALAGVYEAEGDSKNLVEMLARVGELSTDEAERQRANERVAETAAASGDVDRAISAWRRLVDSPARARALEALEPLYEKRAEWIDLSFVLEQRAKDMTDRAEARALSFRAAEVLTTKARDASSASQAWQDLVAAYGPARDAYAFWMPLLESQRQWPELAEALERDAELAADEEKAPVLARLGNVYLTRLKDVDRAIDALRRALEASPGDKASRAALEKLLLTGDHRLEAAKVLEPFYRKDDDVAGLVRVLDITAQLSPIVQDRLAALEEAADAAIAISRDKALELVGRGLAEAAESAEDVAPWLGRFDLFAGDTPPKRRAQILAAALGDRAVDSPILLTLARRVGEEHAASGDVAAALAVYRRALAYDPSSAELVARVDELLQEQGNPEERVALYRAALERGAEGARRRQLLHSIGSLERGELGRPDAAIAAYARALEDDPTDAPAHAALVELYGETEAWPALIGQLEAHLGVCTSPEEARSTRAKLAEVAAEHGDPARAAASARALLDDPDLGVAVLELLERVAERLSDTELLKSALERRARDAVEPGSQMDALERLAKVARDAGDDAHAVARLRQAADVSRSVGDEARAIQLLARLREIAPRDADATSQLVELYERAEAFEALPALLAVLLEIAPNDVVRVGLERRLARLLAERLGDASSAFDAARRAFALSPSDADVAADLSALAIAAGRGADFARAVDEALASGAVDEGARAPLTLARARVLASSEGTHHEAAAAFRAVLEDAGASAHEAAATEGLEALLRIMPASDERSTHVRWLRRHRVDRAAPEERSRALLAWAEAEETDLGDPDEALRLYRSVLEIDPDEIDALAAISRLALAKGDVEGALAALESRREASEGEARDALDVQIATILIEKTGGAARTGEALDRIASVLEATPHHAAALELAARLLRDPEVSARAASVLESSIDAVDDLEARADMLRRLVAEGEPRLDLYERLLDVLAELGADEEASIVVLRAARALPGEDALWDRAEETARREGAPEPVAALFEEVLRGEIEKEQAVPLGQRAVAFYEEWFEDDGRVVGILERLLAIDPDDTWAFDRLKLIFDAQERWDDLFALYDRAIAMADRERRLELLEDAAQIAKDFANHSTRAIAYLEQLLELKPGNARLSSALERLYERHGCHKELIGLLGARLPQLSLEEAQKERMRIAAMWLDELGDASSALIVIEDVLSHEPEGGAAPSLVVTDVLERVLALAPVAAEVRESVAPLPDTPPRRDSYLPMAQKRGLVRQRAAALLKGRYSEPGREADLARVLEVELEAVKSVKERIRRHQQIAALYAQLGDDEHAMDHFVHLVLLEPEVRAHRDELVAIAARVGRLDRLRDVLVAAADDSHDEVLKVELLMHAGTVSAEIDDAGRAIELFFRVLTVSPVSDDALLEACRKLAPLLDAAGRAPERLDVLERLAILEADPAVRGEVLGEAARLATALEEDDRAIWAWEGRLETTPDDPEALDGLVALFEKADKWRPLIDALDKRAKLERAPEDRRADRVRVAHIQSEKLEATEEAIETWQSVEATFGESDEGTRALSALYRLTHRWQELAELLARAAERASTPDDRAEVLRELGDVQREQLDAIDAAIASYEAALTCDARIEGARSGLRALLKRPEHRAEVVRVLLAAYNAADDWRLVLDLTEHRLNAARETGAQIAILMEAAGLSESRAQDESAAFALVRRALLFDPKDEATLAELFRLAEVTRSFRALADALRECLDAHEGESPPWAGALRFRMAEVLETRLDEPRAALDAYVQVADEDPGDLEAARAVIRVAGRTTRADAAARAVVEATRARGALEPSLVEALEDAALARTSEPGEKSGWDAITFALASLVQDDAAGAELPPALARDLEALVAVWHRDRRGDPDEAEAAYGRALAHDPTNAAILGELAQLQRRAKGRPLVDSLLRLSQTTGGDLDLLTEAADVALASVGDRALAKSILERLFKLAVERWTGPLTGEGVSSGPPAAPESYVERATRELSRIHADDGEHEKIVDLLVETAGLPWPRERSRELRHEAAQIARDRAQAPDRAIGIYLGLIDEDPLDAEAVERAVDLYRAGGRSTELLELKRRLVTSAPDAEARLSLRLEVAELEDALSNAEGAIAALRENLAESARHEPTVLALSELLSREGKLAELEALYAHQAELAEEAGEHGAAADLHARAGEVAENKLGDVPAAIAHLRRVVALEARPSALDALARLSRQVREYGAAAEYLDRLREAAPEGERADVTLRLADALALAGKSDDARQRLESEVARDPEADRVRMRLAEMYRAAGALRELAELLAEGAAHAPDKATRLARLREAAELHRAKTGEPDRAIPLLEQASDLSPDDNAVKLALADALGAASRFDEARALLRTLVEAFGGRRPKERAPVHYHLARLDLAVGDRARALVELDAATRIDPANPAILQALAELARDDGQVDRAERSYRALLTVLRRQDTPSEDAPITRAEVMFELSRIAAASGEIDRAKEILESAFELSAESVVEARRLEAQLRAHDDHANLARALEARLTRAGAPDASQAAPVVDAAALLARVSDASEVYGELGRLFEEHLDRRDEALAMRLVSLDLDPRSDDAHAAAQRLAVESGRPEAYEERLRALAEAAGDEPELAAVLYVRLGRVAEARGEDREAAELFERAAQRSPRDRDVLAALARVYEKLGDDAGQARVLGVRVALDAEEGGASSDALYRLAQLRFRSGEVDAACDAFEDAFEAEPDGERALALLHEAAEAHPTSERVVAIYERLARAPGHERALVDALVRRWTLPGESADPMREAVEIAEDKLEDRDLAESLLRRFLESATDDAAARVWALSKLAWISEETGRVREAVLLKREAAELAEPDDARRLLFEVAGLASGPVGDLRLAASIYEELHERDATDRDAWELLLDVYRRTNDYDKLVALVQEIVAYVDDVSERSRLRLERVKVGMGKLRLSDDDAALELREIVDEDPSAVDAAILLGTILERSGREEDLAELLASQLDAAKDRQDVDAVSSLSRRLGQLLEGRDRQEARAVYEAALDWDARDKEILLALERLHEQDGDVEARADVMEKRLALEGGEQAEAMAIALAAVREQLEDRDAALRALEVGFAASPQSVALRDRLEIVYREQLEHDKLAELYVKDARGREDAREKSLRLREAARLYQGELSDPEQGARVLREAREADPSDPELLFELVDMLVASGERAAAAAELSNVIDGLAEDDPARVALVGRRAVIRSHLGEAEGALSDFEVAVAAGVELRAELADHLGKMALQAAGRGEAAEWRRYRLRVADLRLSMGNIEEARDALTELLKTDSKDKATLRAVAHLDELEERWDAASATYRRLVGLEDAEGIVSAALKLTETCAKAGRLADARGGLERARLARPDATELRDQLAWVYEQLGATKELAELVLEQAREAGDVAPRFEGLMRAGQLFLEHAQAPDATAQAGVSAAVAPLEEAHALRPSDLDCAALLSDAYVGAGRFEEAQELLQRTIAGFKGRRARELSPLYHRLARIAEIVGDRATELQYLTSALDMDAQSGAVASELAYLAMELQSWDVAQRALRAVTMLKVPAPLPKALAYQHLGEIARHQGDNKRAMLLLKRAIDDDPTLESARALLDALQAGG